MRPHPEGGSGATGAPPANSAREGTGGSTCGAAPGVPRWHSRWARSQQLLQRRAKRASRRSRSAWSISSADEKRCRGSVASAFVAMRRKAGGSSRSWFSPANKRRPDSASTMTAPTEYRSDWTVAEWPARRSGARYPGVPRTTPVMVMSEVASDAASGVEALCDPEVGDARVAVVVEQDVARLDVAVEHAEPVGGGQGAQRVGHECGETPGWHRPAGDFVTQRAAGETLHHEVGDRTVLSVVEDGHDVGVHQPRRDAGLLLEAPPHARQGFGLGAQDLDGDRAFQAFVEAVEHPRHAAFAQERVEAVTISDHPYDRARLHPCCLPAGNGDYSCPRSVDCVRA